MWKYSRYWLLTCVGLVAIGATFAGGAAMWLGFGLAFLLALGGDSIFGDDLSEPDYGMKWLLDLGLYFNLPLLLAYTFAFAWQLSESDLFGVGAALGSLTGYDLLAARDASTWTDLFGAALGLGMFYGAAGTNVGHELTHRTWSIPAQVTGRWLLAFTSDASFAIEHVYGHHKRVATVHDPATSRRGENVYGFILRSTVHSYLSAWEIERERLARKGKSVWSWENRMHRGNLMTLSYFAFFFWAAGPLGLAAFTLVSAYGKCWLEIVNYTEHYGLVRVPDQPVEPRHSWNCNRRISGYLLYNLTRHSHHHAMGDKPFWELRAYPDTPMMPAGYLTMIVVALIPPLWNKLMIPRVLAWDKRFASEAELPLIQEANRRSGMKIFTEGLPDDELPMITSPLEDRYNQMLAANENRPAPSPSRAEGVGEVIRGLFAGSPRKVSLEPSGALVQTEPGQTILTAALESGVAFPHNCRVGGCASCKCKLVTGEVKELTDSSYVLSGEELSGGYILACQSVPLTDVTLEVPGLRHADAVRAVFKTGAEIVALEALTHDITRVVLELDGPIEYTAGQYARLSVPGVIDEPRSYSFAAACVEEMVSRVEFHVRLVPGGEFTTWLHESAQVGDRLRLEGPFGDFWMRPGRAPIMGVAGGSGMAPLKALLEQAALEHVARDVIYFFGARTQEDLYCVDEMNALAKRWRARMVFVPVLSEEPGGSDWGGLRGFVTDHLGPISATRLTDHHVYMCGPPAMIDAAEQKLTDAGVPREQIFADRFLDRSHAPGSSDSTREVA